MPIDKVKPLKIESGIETDFSPTETNPTEDYIAAKGIALENSDTHRVEKKGDEVGFDDPVNGSKKVSDLVTEVQEDDVTKVVITKIINFKGNVNVTDEGNGKATVSINADGADDVEGITNRIITHEFNSVGSLNRYYDISKNTHLLMGPLIVVNNNGDVVNN